MGNKPIKPLSDLECYNEGGHLEFDIKNLVYSRAQLVKKTNLYEQVSHDIESYYRTDNSGPQLKRKEDIPKQKRYFFKLDGLDYSVLVGFSRLSPPLL